MKVYTKGGDLVLKMWYAELNKDDKKAFDEFIQATIDSLGPYFDESNPGVNIMSDQMMEFAYSISFLFPDRCTPEHHRYMHNVLLFRKCPDCGQPLLKGPKIRRK
jgi:hypothetical protein